MYVYELVEQGDPKECEDGSRQSLGELIHFYAYSNRSIRFLHSWEQHQTKL